MDVPVSDDQISSLAAERAVIGAILLNEVGGHHDAIREARQIAAPGDFGSVVLGALFALMTGRYAVSEAIDPIALWPSIQNDEMLARNLRSPAALHDLMEATPTASNVAYYAKQVSEAGQSRRLLDASYRLAQLARATDMEAAQKVTTARSEIEAIASDYVQVQDVPTLSEVLAVPDEYDWVIPGFMERMDRLVLTGGEGLGKSTWLRQIAVLAAAGIHPTQFHSVDPVRVTVIDTENTERQWRRKVRPLVHKATLQGQVNPGDAIRLHCTGRLDVNSVRDVATIHSILDRYPTDILLIGPLYKLTSRGLNDETDAAQVITALDHIRERGICLLMEAHAGKAIGGDGERNMSPRGSAALLGWPEFGLGLAWDTSMISPGEKPSVVNVKRWRGDREDDRAIPERMSRGGEWPWTDVERRSNRWTPSDALEAS